VPALVELAQGLVLVREQRREPAWTVEPAAVSVFFPLPALVWLVQALVPVEPVRVRALGRVRALVELELVRSAFPLSTMAAAFYPEIRCNVARPDSWPGSRLRQMLTKYSRWSESAAICRGQSQFYFGHRAHVPLQRTWVCAWRLPPIWRHILSDIAVRRLENCPC
jgi:hypothetical protein